MNVIGLPIDNDEYRTASETVIKTLPSSPNNFVISSQSAELFKYAHNLNGYFRVILANILFEVNDKHGADWSDIKVMMDSDVMMSPFYNNPVHKGGRGAGGNCFVKDMAAFRYLYESEVSEDKSGLAVLKALEKKNIELLHQTNKSQGIVKGVYGKDLLE